VKEKKMDFDNFSMWRQRPVYLSVSGTITQMQRMNPSGRGYGGCSRMVEVQDEEGGITNFFINTDTYVVGFETLYEGMRVTMFYNGNLPAPLIYPPQFIAAVVAPEKEGRMVAVGFFDQSLLASDRSLQLNLSPDTQIVTSNNQIFTGNLGGRILVVVYSNTTRSIPPQTTPQKIIVLCGQQM